MNKIVREDIENLLNSDYEIINKFDNNTILITGASGLVGSFLVNTFLLFNKKNNSNINIIALVHNIEKAKSLFNDFLNDKCLKIIECDIVNSFAVDEDIDYIIHGASITSSKLFANKPVDTIKVAILGSINMLELAVNKKVKSIIYLSSIEAYGLFDCSKNNVKEIKEDDVGKIDTLSVRSCYPESKRMVENMFISYSQQYDIDIKIARLTQTFGAGIDYNDTRVFAEFAKNVINKNDIILHSKGETIRNYCYITDAISAIIYIILYGKNQNIYNVASDNSIISIYDLAKTMIEKSNNNVEIIIKNDINNNMGYLPTFKAYLNNDKLKSIGWTSKYNIDSIVSRLIEYMKSIKGM